MAEINNERAAIDIFASDDDSSDDSLDEDDNVLENLLSDSSSDSDSGHDSNDEDVIDDIDDDDPMLPPLLHNLMHGRRRIRVDNYLEVVRHKSDQDFLNDYRLRRPVAYELIDRLNASGRIPVHNFGPEKKTAELSFLLFLWYIGNKEPLRTLADRFDVSESSAFRIIRRVASWLVTLVPEYVKWPRGDDIRQTCEKFALDSPFSGCLGALDGSYIPIFKPMANHRDYWCRKKYHAINLTAICNKDKKFTMLFVGEPGSMHDITVFRNSPFYQAIEENWENVFPNGTYILADGGYQGLNSAWAVIPFRDNGALTQRQREFNTILSSSRVVIENAFGLLKGRFRRLMDRVHIFDREFLVDVVLSCCALHNVCMDNGDDGEQFRVVEENEEENQRQDGDRAPEDLHVLGRRGLLFQRIFRDDLPVL